MLRFFENTCYDRDVDHFLAKRFFSCLNGGGSYPKPVGMSFFVLKYLFGVSYDINIIYTGHGIVSSGCVFPLYFLNFCVSVSEESSSSKETILIKHLGPPLPCACVMANHGRYTGARGRPMDTHRLSLSTHGHPTYGHPWETYGQPIDTHGRPMETHGDLSDPPETHRNPWETHGSPIDDPRDTHGRPTEASWETTRDHENPWQVHGSQR